MESGVPAPCGSVRSRVAKLATHTPNGWEEKPPWRCVDVAAAANGGGTFAATAATAAGWRARLRDGGFAGWMCEDRGKNYNFYLC